jgi:hypothetical protein
MASPSAESIHSRSLVSVPEPKPEPFKEPDYGAEDLKETENEQQKERSEE